MRHSSCMQALQALAWLPLLMALACCCSVSNGRQLWDPEVPCCGSIACCDMPGQPCKTDNTCHDAPACSKADCHPAHALVPSSAADLLTDLHHPAGGSRNQSAIPVLDAAGDGSGARALVSGDVGADARNAHKRMLVTSTPAGPPAVTSTNGSYTALFPLAFGPWCLSDATCLLQSVVTVSLSIYAYTGYTSATTGWPTTAVPATGVKPGSIIAISAVANYQLNYKQNTAICSSSSPCTATLTIPLSAGYDPNAYFLCVNLVPTAADPTIFTAQGYPNGTNGTSVATTVVSGALVCNVTQLGQYMIVQYYMYAPPPLISPSPPPAKSTISPPPPPPLLTPPPPPYLGNVGSVAFRFTISFQNVSFDNFTANAVAYDSFLVDVTSHLIENLAVAMPALLLDAASGLPAYSLLTVTKVWRGPGINHVNVDFSLLTPGGTTSAQLTALEQLISINTIQLFVGSAYASKVLPGIGVPTDVAARTMPLVLLVIIGVCGLIVTALLLGLLYAGWLLWRIWPILPKEEEYHNTPSMWDPAFGKEIRKPLVFVRTQQVKVMPAPSPPPPPMAAPKVAPTRAPPNVSYQEPRLFKSRNTAGVGSAAVPTGAREQHEEYRKKTAHERLKRGAGAGNAGDAVVFSDGY